ncbi:hypothetical protein P691DRAFT_766591 [Macrolepiota fuliginosa MF-IS2]|uniref:Uncharacterized protein n=1 Tax=Macrolepiota fuliginosa MF-IS2 TaxID=1400762 RepID=A0A9P5WZI9_9AGAR|nr:hypothetical protein P691DRAFT_766591 [Macrolepiota fuliginosa MF-IS2]
MACKPRTRAQASDSKLSNTTVAILNAQNQDLYAQSIVQTSLLITLPKLAQVQVCHELNTIGFTYEAPTLPLPPAEFVNEADDNTDDEMDIHLFNDTLTHLLKWCIFKLAKIFNLVTIVTLPTPPPPPLV